MLVAGGPFTLGADDPWAYDNERPAHDIDLAPFRIGRALVTNAEYAAFVDAGGYRDSDLWSEEGWAWREAENAVAPLGWEVHRGGRSLRRFDVVAPLPHHEPVQHVSFHEAAAYARWVGKRLPTEPEWEKALQTVGEQLEHARGAVWQWTSSFFHPYPGFRAFPYAEYSEVFFGERYMVLARWFVVHRSPRRPADVPQLGSSSAPADLLRRPLCVRCLGQRPSGACASMCSGRSRRSPACTTRRSGACEAGLKTLPAVWLYDERGSRLYEEITRLPEYYLPRREREILRARAAAIARAHSRRIRSSSSAPGVPENTRLLLDALDTAGTLERFVPLDVSEPTLRASAQAIAAAYPRLVVHALVGDFERDLDRASHGGRRLIAFLGSTIGNLDPEQRGRFLANVASLLGRDGALLLGIDLVKDVARLEAAYNDSRGVTEAFVRNALTAVNRELDATFDQRRFVYEAHWDSDHEWMDIGLRARRAHTVSIQRSRARRGVRGRASRSGSRSALSSAASSSSARPPAPGSGSNRGGRTPAATTRLRSCFATRPPEVRATPERKETTCLQQARSAATSTRSR